MTDQANIATELNAAGVPKDAMARLAELQPGKPGSIFTSDLSVNEFLLVKEAGFHPLGFVMGSSIYHIGIQNSKWGQNMELTTLTQAMYNARELAMSRMQAEAEALHAEGIVGVQLRQHSHTWGSHTTEFFAIGTAVRPLRADHIIERPTMVLTLDA